MAVDFADRYVTVADPLGAFDEAYIEAYALLFASEFCAEAVVPLSDWSFDRLRWHFVETLDEYAAMAEGEGSDPAPDRGSDVSKAFGLAFARARKAFRQPDYLGARRMTPLGLQPGAVVVQHVINELVSHAWDLARSIDRKVKVPDWLVDRVRLSWEIFFETFGRPDFNFGPALPAPSDASASDRLAAYLGRDVST